MSTVSRRPAIARPLVAALALFGGIAQAGAATFVVNSQADAPDGNTGNGICDAVVGGQTVCTLRAALMQAANNDIVELPSGTYALTRPRDASQPDESVGDLDIHAETIEIRGPADGERPVIRPGAGFDDVLFRITTGGCPGGGGMCQGHLKLRRLVLDGVDPEIDGFGGIGCGAGRLGFEDVLMRNFGVSGHGAAIGAAGCHITLTRAEFRNNRAGGRGGALNLSQGDPFLTGDAVSFIDNTAGVSGGAIYHDNYAITLHNATLAGNRAPVGAAVRSYGAQLTLVNATVTGNGGPGGGEADNAILASTLRPANSIIAGNQSLADIEVSGILQSDGYNLLGPIDYIPASAIVTLAPSDILDPAPLNLAGPLIAPWSLTGIATMPPADGSPAIDAGHPGGDGVACRPADANGHARLGLCDIGAAEQVGSLPFDIIFADGFEPLPPGIAQEESR